MDKHYIGTIRNYRLYIAGQEVEVWSDTEMVTMQAVRLGMEHFK